MGSSAHSDKKKSENRVGQIGKGHLHFMISLCTAEGARRSREIYVWLFRGTNSVEKETLMSSEALPPAWQMLSALHFVSWGSVKRFVSAAVADQFPGQKSILHNGRKHRFCQTFSLLSVRLFLCFYYLLPFYWYLFRLFCSCCCCNNANFPTVGPLNDDLFNLRILYSCTLLHIRRKYPD